MFTSQMPSRSRYPLPGRRFNACSRLVVAVVIYPVDALTFCRLTQIRVEVFKFLPTFTDLYSSTSIPTKSLSFLIRATLLHCSPYPVYPRVPHSVCCSPSTRFPFHFVVG